MVHEIMHGYFDFNKTHYKLQFEQHKDMAEGYIEELKNAVKTVYPNLGNKDACALILNGFGDIFKKDLPYWNALLSQYDLDNVQIINIRDAHKTQSLGTKTTCL